MNTKKRIKIVLTIAITVMVVLAVSAQAETLEGELGILDLTANGGINPATQALWAEGDTYRLAFYTSGTINSESADIVVYNEFVQGLADATTVYDIGVLEGVTWNIIGSTDEVDARDNTSTNPYEDGTGETIFLLDGTTVVANNYADLWDGSIQHVINLTELGILPDYLWPCTGTYIDGTEAPGHGGSHGAIGDGGEIQQGNASSLTEWVWRSNTSGTSTKERPTYALSNSLLIISVDPALPDVEAGSDWITWSGEPVVLDDVEVVNNLPSALTYSWSASPSAGVVFTPNDGGNGSTSSVKAPTVTITKPDGDPITVTLTLAANNIGSGNPDEIDIMQIDVYDDSCLAALSLGPVAFDSTDFNEDCLTNIGDLADLAFNWLVDYKLTEPATEL